MNYLNEKWQQDHIQAIRSLLDENNKRILTIKEQFPKFLEFPSTPPASIDSSEIGVFIQELDRMKQNHQLIISILNQFENQRFSYLNFLKRDLFNFLRSVLNKVSNINKLIPTKEALKLSHLYINRKNSRKFQESQNRRFEFILEGAGLGAWDWWLDTNEVSFDRRWCEMLGLKIEEVEQSLVTWDSRVHPDDKHQAYQDIKSYLDGKTRVYENIHRLRHADGYWVWILDRGRISETDASGRPVRFTGTHLDISKYRNSESLNESIQSIAKIGGWELDCITMKTTWTRETYHIHAIPEGTPTDKIMGISFYAEKDQARIAHHVEEGISGIAYRDTFEFIDAKGVHKWVEVMGQPIFDADGKVIKLQGTIQDVTERELLVQELNTIIKENARYKRWIDNAHEGVWEIDMQGNTIFVNNAMAKILKLSPEELIGRPISDFVKQNWQSIVHSVHNNLTNTTKSFKEFVVLDTEGNSVWLNVSAVSSFSVLNGVKTIVVICSDISVIKMREFQMEALVRSLDDMVFEINATGYFTGVWASDETALLMPPHKIIGKHYEEILPHHVAVNLSEAMSKLSLANRTTSFEYDLKILPDSPETRIFKTKICLQKMNMESGNITIVISDITVSRNAESEKRRAVRMLEKFFGLTLDLLCIVDKDGMFKLLNPQWERTLGYTDQELKSRPFIDFVHPDDVESTLAEFKKLQQGVPSLSFENRYLAKDGSYRILNWSSSPDPETGLFYSAAHDVTEGRSKEYETQQIMTVINKGAIIAEIDASGQIIEVNENFCRTSGYTRSELIGKYHQLTNFGKSSKVTSTSDWKPMTSGLVWTGEIQNRAKNGRDYYLYTVFAPIRDLLGRTRKYLCLHFDVSNVREAEKMLSEAQSCARIGSWNFDIESQSLTWSTEHYRIFEVEEPQDPKVLYEIYKSKIHPDDWLSLEAYQANAMIHGDEYTFDHRVILDTNRFKYVRGIARVTKDSNNRTIRLSGTCQDITELVLAEENIKKERAMALQNAKLASIGEMAAGVAHEINNPLAIILGNLRTLPKYLTQPEKHSEKIETVKKAADRIAKIVKGLGRYAHSNDEKDMIQVDLKKIVEEALTLTAAKSRIYNTTIESDLESHLMVCCDEIAIEQVLINLINNSLDAIKDLDEKWVRINIKREGSDAVLSVTDSGLGISEKVREKIFLPFFTTKQVGEGTGLGLSIVLAILKEHKAKIRLVEESPHTCFEIRFKVATEDQYVA